MTTWTRTKPTMPGAYWYREGSDLWLCHVVDGSPYVICYMLSRDGRVRVSEPIAFDGEWSSAPIKEPKEE